MQKLLALDRALEPSLPALLALLDVPVDDPRWQALDPPERRQRTIDAMKRLAPAESQVQPLLVVVEDLHWIDSETQARARPPGREPPAGPALLLVDYRPEYRHGWGRKTYYHQLRLDPLPPEQARELLRRSSATTSASRPSSRSSSSGPRAIRSSWRRPCGPGRDGVLLGAAAPISCAAARTRSRCRRRSRRPGRAHRPPPARRTGTCSRRPRSSAQTCPSPCCGVAGRPEDALAEGSPACRPPNSCTSEPGPGPRVHLQACAHPRGRLRQPAPGPAAAPPRPDRGGHRAALSRPPGRARRAAGPPRLPGRGVGKGGHLPPAGRRQGLRRARPTASGRLLRAGADGADPPSRDPRDAGAGHRHPLRASQRPGLLADSAGSKRISGKRRRLAATLDDQRRLGWVSAYMAGYHGCDRAHDRCAGARAASRGIAEALGDVRSSRRSALCPRVDYLSGDYRGPTAPRPRLARKCSECDPARIGSASPSLPPSWPVPSWRAPWPSVGRSTKRGSRTGSAPDRGGARAPAQPHEACWGSPSLHAARGTSTRPSPCSSARSPVPRLEPPGLCPRHGSAWAHAYAASGRVGRPSLFCGRP